MTVVGIQPGGNTISSQDHRHSVMDGLHQTIGLGGDDDAGREFTIRSTPMVDKPGEHEDPAPRRADEEGGLGLAGGLPLIEPTCGDETPAMAQGTSKGRLGADPLSPSVDGLGATLGVLGPAGHKAPSSQHRDPLVLVRPYSDDPLPGSNVEAALYPEASQPRAPKRLGKLLGRGEDCKPTAHWARLLERAQESFLF